jgi:hypothetical protein
VATASTNDLRSLLRRRPGWRVDDDGHGARYHRRGAAWSGLVRALSGADRSSRWHAALIEGGTARLTTRWYYASDAVAWVEAQR